MDLAAWSSLLLLAHCSDSSKLKISTHAMMKMIFGFVSSMLMCVIEIQLKIDDNKETNGTIVFRFLQTKEQLHGEMSRNPLGKLR